MHNTTDIDYVGAPYPMGYPSSGCGMGAGGFLGGLILGSLFTRRGGGGFLGGGDGCDGVLPYQAGVNAGEAAKYRDIVDATTSLTGTIRNGFDVTGVAIGNIKDQLFAVSAIASQERAAILRAQCETDYKNLLQSKELSSQMAMSTCEIKQAVHCDGEKTRAILVAQNEQNLRDRLEEVTRQRDLLVTGNFPISQPAHVHKFECHNGGGNDFGAQINVINQNVNAIGSTVAQLAGVVQALAQAKAAA